MNSVALAIDHVAMKSILAIARQKAEREMCCFGKCIISKVTEGKEKLTFEYCGPQSEPNTTFSFVSFSV